MSKKLNWSEKLQECKPYKIKRLDKNFAGMRAGQNMLVPSAKLIDDFIKTVPEGEHSNVITLREKLAKQHQVDVTCPIATGFAIKIVAEAAFEAFNQQGSLSGVTPVWRVLDKDSPTLNKVSFDKKVILDLKQAETS